MEKCVKSHTRRNKDDVSRKWAQQVLENRAFAVEQILVVLVSRTATGSHSPMAFLIRPDSGGETGILKICEFLRETPGLLYFELPFNRLTEAQFAHALDVVSRAIKGENLDKEIVNLVLSNPHLMPGNPAGALH